MSLDKQQIIDAINTRPLRRSAASTPHNTLNLPELIEAGIMPYRLPCENPCPRAENNKHELFTCDTCLNAPPNPIYYSSYKKTRVPASLRREVWERDNFTCKECGTHQRLTVDHIIPECQGGKTELSNLQTLCKICNSRKGDNA
jgi:5-methylcytosine-specific restriction endonuclease McrA